MVIARCQQNVLCFIPSFSIRHFYFVSLSLISSFCSCVTRPFSLLHSSLQCMRQAQIGCATSMRMLPAKKHLNKANIWVDLIFNCSSFRRQTIQTWLSNESITMNNYTSSIRHAQCPVNTIWNKAKVVVQDHIRNSDQTENHCHLHEYSIWE